MNKTLTTAIALLATGAANAACLSTDQFNTAEDAAIFDATADGEVHDEFLRFVAEHEIDVKIGTLIILDLLE